MGESSWVTEEHPKQLGKLIGNLHTIEELARFWLAINEAGSLEATRPELPKIKEGDLVDITPLSGPESLKPILEKYNKHIPKNCPDLKVDVDTIVNLRDALAHGRVFGFGDPQNASLTPLRLIKFAKNAKNKKVKVELCADMTDEWFTENIQILEKGLDNMRQALDWLKTNVE